MSTVCATNVFTIVRVFWSATGAPVGPEAVVMSWSPSAGPRDDEIGIDPRRADDGTRATTAGPRATEHRVTRRHRHRVRVRPRARRTSTANDARGGVLARVGAGQRAILFCADGRQQFAAAR